ncbi:MAG: alpha/beta hydrolase, partial [Caulobacteraceae bacterium]
MAAASSTTACSSVAVLNAIEPKGGVTIIHDIAYRAGERGGLDVYRPSSARGHAPVVVFFYGGGWDTGHKADYAFAGAALA